MSSPEHVMEVDVDDLLEMEMAVGHDSHHSSSSQPQSPSSFHSKSHSPRNSKGAGNSHSGNVSMVRRNSHQQHQDSPTTTRGTVENKATIAFLPPKSESWQRLNVSSQTGTHGSRAPISSPTQYPPEPALVQATAVYTEQSSGQHQHVYSQQNQLQATATGTSNLPIATANPQQSMLNAAVTRIPTEQPQPDPTNSSTHHPNDNDNSNSNGNTPTKVVVQAEEAGLTDFLENRNLQFSLGSILCVVVCGAVVIAGIVVVINVSSNTTTQATTTSAPTTLTLTANPTETPTITTVPPVHPPPTPDIEITPQPSNMALDSTTAPPTPTPLLVELPDYTVAALKNAKSPQARAYQWLQQHPNIQSLQPWQIHQFMALISIYYATNGTAAWDDEDTTSSSTTSSSSYKQNILQYNRPICTWLPTITTPSNRKIEPCNDHGQLTHLRLENVNGERIERPPQSPSNANDNIITIMPPEIALLTSLQSIQVYNCHFEHFRLAAFWPTQLSTLPNLQKLEFYENVLEGSIPSTVLLLPALQQSLTHLSLDFNNLMGTIPTEIGLLTSLQYLSLVWNDIQGTIPTEIGNLSQLTTLRLYNNELEGAVPSELLQLTRLQEFLVQRNDLRGDSLPQDLCDEHVLPSLQDVRTDCQELPCPSSCQCRCTGL